MFFEIRETFRDGTILPEIKINILFSNPTKEELEIERNLYFNIKTYNSIKQNFALLSPILNFINELNDNDKRELFYMFYEIKLTEIENNISSVEFKNMNLIETDNDFKEFNQNIDITIEKISNIIYEYFKKIRLIDKLKDYVNRNIKLPNLSSIGKRPQDSKDTTFMEHEYIELSILSMICKLLCPVFGEIIYWFNKSSHLDKTVKEIYAVKILQLTLDHYFSTIIDKIQNYITKTLSNIYNDDDINALFKGLDSFKLKIYIYSTILTKKLVNINLFDNTKNIVTYIYSCIIDTCGSQLKSLKKGVKVMERFEASEYTEDDKDLIEHETGKNIQKIGTLIFIRKCIDSVIDQLINMYNIDKSDLQNMIQYYNENTIEVTPFNKFVISMILSKFLKCGSSVRFLNIHQYTYILSIIQLILVDRITKNNQDKYEELLHILSCKTTNQIKKNKSNIDYELKFGYFNKNDYEKINNILSLVTKKEDSLYIFQEMRDLLITKINIYNTSDIIWKKLNKENMNFNEIQYSKDIISKILNFAIDF